MKYQNLSISLLNKKNTDDIYEVWANSLPNNLKTLIGKGLIYNYLDKFFEVDSNLSVGVFDSKKLIGFILFGDDKNIINKVIKKNWKKIIIIFFKNILKLEVKKVARFIDTLIFIILNKKFEEKIKNNNKNTELLIVGVTKEYQNEGVGTFLINEVFEKYKNYFLKFEYVFVKTLPTSQNIIYYKKLNFLSEAKIVGRVYLKKKI